MDTQVKQRIAVEVLNGATGEVREVVAHVAAPSEQAAVDMLFARARQDDYYYRFLGMRSVIEPTGDQTPATRVLHQNQTFWARE